MQRISDETVLKIGIRACNYGIVRCEATSLNVLQPRHCGHSRINRWPLPRVSHNCTTQRVQHRQSADHTVIDGLFMVPSTHSRLVLALFHWRTKFDFSPPPPHHQSSNNPNIDMNSSCISFSCLIRFCFILSLYHKELCWILYFLVIRQWTISWEYSAVCLSFLRDE